MLSELKKKELEKLKQQQKNMKEQQVNMPKIKKVKPTNITNITAKTEKSNDKKELEIRNFIKKVIKLTDEDLNEDSSQNIIIHNGMEEFKKDKDKDKKDDNWVKLSTFKKLIYILKAYSLTRNIDYNVKQILNNDLYLYIGNKKDLKVFLKDFLHHESTFYKSFLILSDNKNVEIINENVLQQQYKEKEDENEDENEEEKKDENEDEKEKLTYKEQQYKEYLLNMSTHPANITTLTQSEMKNVLITLNDDILYDLAHKKGIKNPEKRGKYSLINIIIRKEFPVKTKKAKELVMVKRENGEGGQGGEQGGDQLEYDYKIKEDEDTFEIEEFNEEYLNTLSLDELKSLNVGPYRYTENFEDKSELVVYILKSVKIYKLIDIDPKSKYMVEDLIEKYGNLSLKELDELISNAEDEGDEIDVGDVGDVGDNIKTQDFIIKEILSDLISDETIKLMSETVSKELLKISPMKSDYGTKIGTILSYDTPYIKILIDSLKSGTYINDEFFKKVANLIVYLKIPQAKLFKNNIQSEYYLPDILANLSSYEKLPEVFEDPLMPYEIIEKTSRTISDNIDKLVKSFAENVYLRRNLYKTRSYFPRENINYNVKTRDRLTACENKNRVNGVPDEEIVYYNDDIDNKIYCFTVNELLTQFLDNNINNPETDRDFNTHFVIRFLELYNNKLHENTFRDKTFQQDYGFNIQEKVKKEEDKKDVPDIIPDLWAVIGLHIKELEDELTNEKGEGEEREEGEEGEEGEEREEAKREKDVIDGIRETADISQTDVCEYCKTHLADDSLKTIVQHNDESKIIQFCSIKCFEDKNDGWDKYKKTVQKKKEKTEEKTVFEPRLEALEKFKEEDISKILTEEEIVKILTKQYNNNFIAFLKRKPFEISIVTSKPNDMNPTITTNKLKTKTELRKYAKEKNVKLPKGLNKNELVNYIFKHTVDKKERKEWVNKELEIILNKTKKTIKDVSDFIFTELYKNTDKSPEYVNYEKEKWILKWLEKNNTE